ncbi:MAG: TetR/AcrR family transcriptional regulator [Lachnospiraceae bacterium]|nr:TetR/AcrR family transcriptional regulator [Lachnospiraceae bacterium]
MPRTITITKENLIDASVSLLKREGQAALTARKLAKEAGCSTQPIFRAYQNMEELYADVFGVAAKIFSDHCASYPNDSNVPFVNLGLAYISFAQNNKELFRLLFLSDNRYGRSLVELLNGETDFLKAQISLAKEQGCKDPQGLFMKMWMLIHGSACMSLTDDYDLDIYATRSLLEDAERVFA